MSDNLRELKSLYNKMRLRVNNRYTEIEMAKRDNKILKTLDNDLEKVENVEKNLKIFVNMLSTFKAVTDKEDLAYKERRVNYLCSYIDANLEHVFPYDNFKSKINLDLKYNNKKAELALVDKYGKSRIPAYSEGKMLRQLISFSSAVGLAECLGKSSIYMDEAFSASSPENLTKAGKVLESLLKKNFQVILIEQTNEIYKDLPRREIVLEKEPIKDEVIVKSITDY